MTDVRGSVMINDVAATLSDKLWEVTQIKTFTKWVNLYLGKRGMFIENISTDFHDGIKLINLLEIISDTKLAKYNKTPKLKIHQIANLNVAHEFIKNFFQEVGIKVVPSPEQINEGDLRSILGLIWVLILRFSIADIDEGGQSAKEGLLLWCQRNTAGYEGVDPPGIENFHTSWKNGLGFGALINKFRPDLLDYSALDQSNPKACMEEAFRVAAEKLNIPRLLDPEDIADVAKPDEKSVMTYLAEYWKVFSADTKIYLATKRLKRAINRRLVNMTLRDEYVAGAQALLEKIDKESKVLEMCEFGSSFDILRNQYFEFEEFKTTTKARISAEKLHLDAGYHALQSKLQSEKFPPYTPPEGLELAKVNEQYERLVALEGPYETLLTEALTALFQQTFDHFDHDSTKTLSKEELQACFSALSLELTPNESELLYGGEEAIPFTKFCQFMMDKLVDSSDKNQIKEACKIVSREKAYVGASDLETNIGQREFEWVKSTGANYDAGDGADAGSYIDVDKMTEALFAPL